MIRLYAIFIFLLIVPSISAQKDCVMDAEGVCVARGPSKSIKVKTTYGGQYETKIRTGKWTFFNNDGAKVAEGEYKVKNDISYQDGPWLYYNEDGELMMTRVYNQGHVVSTTYHSDGCYKYQNDSTCIQSDTLGNMNVVEVKGQLSVVLTTAKNVVNKPNQPKVTYNGKTYDHEKDSVFRQRFPSVSALESFEPYSAISENNLINNGDFEKASDMMTDGFFLSIDAVKDKYAPFWASASQTPDIYKRSGNCFAGYRVLGVNYEVLRNTLKSPLKAETRYCLQFKLKLKEENYFAINGVSALVSDKVMSFNNCEEWRRQGPILQTHPSLVLGLREKWMNISGEFTASGGEKYLYIGNFSDLTKLKVFKADSSGPEYIDEVYYYIDDVVLTEMGENQHCPCNVAGCAIDSLIGKEPVSPEADPKKAGDFFVNPKVGQSIVLRNIQFETAKWDLLEGSYATLDSLLELMIAHPGMVIEVIGHTDNRGKAADNKTLSLNRANAVIWYLTENGIDESRLKAEGKGQEEPVDTNDSERGRASNRRVEFRILSL